MTPAAFPRPRWEVADVIRHHGEAFLRRHGGHLTGMQKRALRDLARCRTAALGGHVEGCLDCGASRIAYNSCRNRHCPKCQALTRARWLEQQARHLLPVEYYHVVFTLPRELADLALANPAATYDLLLRAAADTLRDAAANPKHLGARVGTLLVLHTWGQNLHHHPHVHAVVTGGGLSCDRHGVVGPSPKWVACRKGFFLPVKVLGRLFRGKYLAGLKHLFERGELAFPEGLGPFPRWLSARYRKAWVVYAKRPFGGPAQVLKYLARYTHRVAIANSRLLDVSDGTVTFGYKDYAAGGASKAMTLPADEFLRRFTQHVLPKGFVKVRHGGLLANRHRAERLHLCRELLRDPGKPDAITTISPTILPVVEACCPNCGGSRFTRRELVPDRRVDATPRPAIDSG
jgi:hypothetical protein